MRFLWRWIKRGLILLVVLVLGLLAPVGYVELACRAEAEDEAYTALIAPEHRRDEAASFLTYPEWHIVFAYDDYARLLEDGDPHDFGYFRAISGFWSAMCNLTQTADKHGGAVDIKNMDYVIGVSFTAELLAKAAYEETVGRVFAWMRGERAAADEASARMAREYAAFLHQVPWYKYDFGADIAELKGIESKTLRDHERAVALGLEFGAKVQYAKAIAQAVAAVGQADLTIRSVVAGLDAGALSAIDGVRVIAETEAGVEIETPRYAAFTDILQQLAAAGGEVVEIAGNDEIMLTVTGNGALPAVVSKMPVLAALSRQGYDDTRWLVQVQMSDLASVIRGLETDAARLEHIFDY